MSGRQSTTDLLKVPPKSSPKTRLAVYQDAYKLRLAGILQDEYPILLRYLGQDAFWRLAHRYMAAMPSNHPNARMFPVRLPEYMQTDVAYGDGHPATEIAFVENAISRAFDARDRKCQTIDALSMLPAERIGELLIDLMPSVSLILCRTNADSIYFSLSNGREPPEATKRDEPCHTLVWRRDNIAKYRTANPEEAMLIEQVGVGNNLAGLCEMAAVMDTAEMAASRIAGYLTDWIENQMIAELTIPDRR